MTKEDMADCPKCDRGNKELTEERQYMDFCSEGRCFIACECGHYTLSENWPLKETQVQDAWAEAHMQLLRNGMCQLLDHFGIEASGDEDLENAPEAIKKVLAGKAPLNVAELDYLLNLVDVETQEIMDTITKYLQNEVPQTGALLRNDYAQQLENAWEIRSKVWGVRVALSNPDEE